jgi:hypothetical protein
MNKLKKSLKFLLWFIFFITFASEFVKIVFELNPDFGHKPLRMANAFFWSSLFLIEMIMAGLSIYFIIKYPARRLRLIILSLCHFTVILALPVLLDSWSWTCLLYPWPHSLQAFDPATPRTAFYVSVLMGFAVVPLITYKWGAKAFCGYLCPHGAFFSETYGRVFNQKPMRFLRAAKVIPPVYFILMTAALLVVIALPGSIYHLRSAQKLVYFFTAELFYFVIGIPLLGGRSYCSLICPMGYFIKFVVKCKNGTRG